MVEIISVKFKKGTKQYYFNPQGMQFAAGEGVIVETAKGLEYAVCAQGNTQLDERELIAPLRPVARKATEEDILTAQKNRQREREAYAICQQKIIEHKLDMKLVDVEYSFDGSKVLFFFTSDGRVDFRALVRDLASLFHARIELRQIGVRDEARMLGGLGICGRPFCCAHFLEEFQPVSIKMAKTQNLSLNPTKISGTCGRLMCCLKYEQEAYEDLVHHAPKSESFVETPDGVGTVVGVNLLRQTVQVRLDAAPETQKTYHNSELSIVRSGKGRRPEGYVQPPLQTLEKLRKKQPEPAQEPTQENRWTVEYQHKQPTPAPKMQGQPPQAAPQAQRPRRSRNKSSRPQQGASEGNVTGKKQVKQKPPTPPAQPTKPQQSVQPREGKPNGKDASFRRRRGRKGTGMGEVKGTQPQSGNQ